ncbi:hypothetical protein HY251_02965 [bacterium]|nr:hypothetical protein [bacterium]
MRAASVTRVAFLALVFGLAFASLASERPQPRSREALGVLPVRRQAPFLRGVCVTLHDEDPEADYTREIDEVATRLGVSHVSVVFHLDQENARSGAPRRGRRTPSEATVRRTLEAARARGLSTLVMPIVVLDRPAKGEWRGSLSPPDRRAWFRAYSSEIVSWAELAERAHASIFCVGSELAWADRETDAWKELIPRVRAVFSGKLAYSANWDDYEAVTLWETIDVIGVTGYNELASSPGASDRALRSGWERVRDTLSSWHRSTWPAKPLVFTEVGYASQRDASLHPWDYTAEREVDLEEQRRCYEAFLATWAPERDLSGVFFYEWWGEGGALDSRYTPRGKPAEELIRRFFDDIRFVERSR